MPTLPAIARRLITRSRSLARRVAPVPNHRLDSIRAHLHLIDLQQDEHMMHIRNLAERVESLGFRLDALESNLNGRLDDLAERSETAVALGWDHVAMSRRLAAIEDRLGVLDSMDVNLETPRSLAG